MSGGKRIRDCSSELDFGRDVIGGELTKQCESRRSAVSGFGQMEKLGITSSDCVVGISSRLRSKWEWENWLNKQRRRDDVSAGGGVSELKALFIV